MVLIAHVVWLVAKLSLAAFGLACSWAKKQMISGRVSLSPSSGSDTSCAAGNGEKKSPSSATSGSSYEYTYSYSEEVKVKAPKQEKCKEKKAADMKVKKNDDAAMVDADAAGQPPPPPPPPLGQGGWPERGRPVLKLRGRNSRSPSAQRGVRCEICYAYVKKKENLLRHQQESTRCKKYQGQKEVYKSCPDCGKWISAQEGALRQHRDSDACRSRSRGRSQGRDPLPRRRGTSGENTQDEKTPAQSSQAQSTLQSEPQPLPQTSPQTSQQMSQNNTSTRQMTFLNCTVHIA